MRFYLCDRRSNEARSEAKPVTTVHAHFLRQARIGREAVALLIAYDRAPT